MTEKIKGSLHIASVDPLALNLGLTHGLTLVDARARVADFAEATSDPHADKIFIMDLADICDQFTPSVMLDQPDGLILDITGCAHLFGGEANLRKRILFLFSRIGIHVRASIAGTPDTARALARFSKVERALPGHDEDAVKRLPVRAISGLDRNTIVALTRAGLKTIGALSERPQQILAARFGQSFVTSLMRTLGRENVRITPLRPVPAVAVVRYFSEPFTQMEALSSVLSSLLDEVFLTMRERNEGGRVFEASFFRSDGAVRRLNVRTSRPSRDGGGILRLYRERLTTLADPLDPGFGFDAIRLCVCATEAMIPAQSSLDKGHADETTRDNESIADLIDQLIVRFGHKRVLRFEARNTHNPDHATRFVSAPNAITKTVFENSPHVFPRSFDPGEPPHRPLQIFKNPQPIEAISKVPDGPPIEFRWRRVLHCITRAEGPERIEPEWWLVPENAKARDYYRVEDSAGCRFWIFQQVCHEQSEGQLRWFLHGIFA